MVTESISVISYTPEIYMDSDSALGEREVSLRARDGDALLGQMLWQNSMCSILIEILRHPSTWNPILNATFRTR